MLKEGVLRTCSIIFNIIILITGLAILGIGIWVVVSDQGFKALLNAVMFAGIYILIAAGAIIILTAVLGLYACRSSSKIAVWVYGTVLLLSVVMKIIGCILTFVFYDDASAMLRETYLKDYGKEDRQDITGIWDALQADGKCCGFFKYSDWEYSDHYIENEIYPTSCCIPSDEELAPQYCEIGRVGYIYEEGCEWAIRHYYYAIGATAIAVIFMELLAILFMACLFQHFR